MMPETPKIRDRVIDLIRVRAGDLVPNPENWRTHPESQRAAYDGMLREVGIADAVIVRREGDRLILIDGHMRQERDPDAMLPALVLDVDEQEARMLMLSLDPIGAMAVADREALDGLLREVNSSEAAVQEMLAELAKGVGLDYGAESERPMPDETPLAIEQLDALIDKYGVEHGQLWAIEGKARHSVICGDSTQEVVVARLLADEEPIGLVFDPDWDNVPEIGVSSYQRVIAFTDGNRAGSVVERFGAPTWIFVWDGVTSWFVPNRPLRRGKLAFWYGVLDDYQFDGAHYGEPDAPHEVSNTRGTYQYQPDPRGKHLSDVFQSPLTRLHSQGLHPYEKPLDWMRLLIGNCFPAGPVYDPFLGSGVSLMACDQLGRPCYGAEILPGYVAYTLERAINMGMGVSLR